jgi:large conductance mechanosensitive channel
VVWAWGSFVDKVLRFVIIALALFMIASMYSRITHDNIIKRQVRCKFCRKYISEKAKRCVNCTSWLDGRDEKPAPAASAEDGH